MRDNHLEDTRLYSKRFFADRVSLLSVDLGIDEKYKPIMEKCIRERVFRRESEEEKKGGRIMKILELGDKWQTAYKQCLYSFKMREAAAIARHTIDQQRYINIIALVLRIGQKIFLISK